MSAGLAGPTLVVRQGEKTEIAITNTMQEPTALHWHGIEVESYYDGVPWWGGIDDKRAPAVEPVHGTRQAFAGSGPDTLEG